MFRSSIDNKGDEKVAKWIECKKCGHKYENSISRCPKCYTKTPITPKKIIVIVLSAVFALFVVLGFILGFIDDSKEPKPNPTSSTEVAISSSEVKETSDSSKEEIASSSEPEKTSNPSSQAIKDEKITDSDGFVTGSKNKKVEVKVPKWLLLSLEPNYDYKITATDKEYGVAKINKNSDGSATFIFNTYNDYQKTVLIGNSAANSACSALSTSGSPITKVEKDSKFQTIKLYTKYKGAEEIDDNIKTAIIMVGLTVCNAQIFDCNAPLNSMFEVYSSQGEHILSLDFPKAGELFYSAMQ